MDPGTLGVCFVLFCWGRGVLSLLFLYLNVVFVVVVVVLQQRQR